MSSHNMSTGFKGPPWQIDQWFNSAPLSLAGLQGRVVVLHAFQMLCPGCVTHGIPQAQRIQRTFADSDVAVVGLHTVFEHHEVMGPEALKVFLHEYRVTFPVGVDRPSPDQDIPCTMQAYGMRGTPSLIIFDRAGIIRYHAFGRPEDIEVGAIIGGLLESRDVGSQSDANADDSHAADGCDENGCEVK